MVAAVSLMKDEADIVRLTVGHMLNQVDRVIVADNGSTDGTREILEELGCEVRDDPEVGYYQSRKISALAHESGAELVVPFDADEIWVAHDGTVGEHLEKLPPEAYICEAHLFDHVATGRDQEFMPWRRPDAAPLRKVAVRMQPGVVIHQGNHSAGFEGIPFPLSAGGLAVHHYPYRSPEQFIRKVRNGAAAYAASDLPEETGAHWRQYGRLTDEQLSEVFYKWFYRDDPQVSVTIQGELQGPLVYDPCPSPS